MKKVFAVVAPCFNEEKSIEQFLIQLEDSLTSLETSFIIIVVDDASTDSSLKIVEQFKFKSSLLTLKLIRLVTNSGHQEAIRQGLNYVSATFSDLGGVIIMDSDGEDDPNAIKELIKINPFDIVFVERGKRHNNFIFMVSYFSYKIIFRLLTGKSISFGNYSLISINVLNAISNQYFLHYPSFLSKQKFNVKKIVYDRRPRIDGRPKMSYQNLIFHGLISFIEYSEQLLFALIKVFLLLILSISGMGAFILYSKFVLHNAIAGWASSLGLGLIIATLIIVSTIIIGLLLVSIKKIINLKSIDYEEIR